MQRLRAAETPGKRGEYLAAIDWKQPWLQGWRDDGEPLALRIAQGTPLIDALNAQRDAPVCFVVQEELPHGESYESYIYRTHSCPTRENLHDFFNALCWMRFPQTKSALNRMQAEQIEAEGIGPVRGAVRNAPTLFDENAALVHAPDALWEALRARDWNALFVDLRPLWKEASLLLFGHALLEKLVAPRKAITAHVWRSMVPTDRDAALDTWLAHDLAPLKLASKPFAALPVLGVPGWWPDNEGPGFLADAAVFRPLREYP